MLHIILGILKVIGIIIGVVLLLLCTVLLSIVFVPVRYRMEAVKEPERTDVKLRVTWLLHAVSVLLYADVTGAVSVTVRLFGIHLPLHGEKGRKNAETGKRGRGRRKKRAEESIPEISKAETRAEEIRENSETETLTGEIRDVSETKDPTEEILDISEAEAPIEEVQDISEAETPTEEIQDISKAETPTEEIRGISETKREDEDSAEIPETQKISVYEKIRCKIQAVCDKIKKVTEAVRHFLCCLKMLPQKLAYAGRRLGALLHKPEEFAQLARKYEAKENLQIVYGYLRFLWKHFRPRSISGYLHFGTGDPALTGQLTGIIYMLLPARADGFEIMPEFDGAVFGTRIVCTGHIRAIHLIRVLIRGFRDEHLRRLIRTVRSGK